MRDADGHEYTFGAPAGGWPTFDADGKRIDGRHSQRPVESAGGAQEVDG